MSLLKLGSFWAIEKILGKRLPVDKESCVEMARILFVDDDAGGRQVACYNLRKAGHEVDEAENGQRALEIFDPARHDLLITDVRMPGISGLELTRQIHDITEDLPILVITAFGKVETAVEALQAGAEDFVLKPFNRKQLLMAVDKALQTRQLRRENKALKRQIQGIERPIVHKSEAMRQVLQMADRIAASEASVLVDGESGSGKELIARRIHARSPRSEGPFVAVNCAAIPAELIESELFGHAKGAFTGAQEQRIGRFRQAQGGSIFLDEIGELPLAAQSKLLRVLQERIVNALGSDSSEAVDLRVIAASNKDLHDEVEAGRFRQDLFYRLNVVEIKIPPLRERREDIAILTEHFVKNFAQDRRLEIPPEVHEALRRRTWSGNVRELQNACERMVLLCSGDRLDIGLLPPERTAPGQTQAAQQVDLIDPLLALPPEGFSLLDMEKRVIERVLELKNNNLSEAARYLRVPRHILVYRVEKYGIERP